MSIDAIESRNGRRQESIAETLFRWISAVALFSVALCVIAVWFIAGEVKDAWRRGADGKRRPN